MARVFPRYTFSLPTPTLSGVGQVGQARLFVEDFSETPLSDTGSWVQNYQWYDDVDIVLGTMPTGGGDAYHISYPANAEGSNGQASPRVTFEEQTGFTLQFNIQCTDMDTVGGGAHHLIYIRSNLDSIWTPPTDGYNLYLEPKPNGEFYIDIRRSADPVNWTSLNATTSHDIYDGTKHTVSLYVKANTNGNSDGVVRLTVDDVDVIDRTDVRLFLNNDQKFNQLSFGPYISGTGTNPGTAHTYIENLRLYSGDNGEDVVVPDNGIINFAASSMSLAVSDDDKTVTVTRVGTDGAVGCTVTSSDGTATAGEDYVAVSETLSFADGVSSATFTISTDPDIDLDGNENFTLTLSSPTGGAELGDNTTMTINILDESSDYSWVGKAPAWTPVEGAYYLAPDGEGSDANDGSIGSPWATYNYAAAQLSGGDTLYLRGGTHTFSETALDMRYVNSGSTEGNGITVAGYPGETAIIDAANTSRCIDHNNNDYWTYRDLTVINASTFIRVDDAINSVGIRISNIRGTMNRGGDNAGFIKWLVPEGPDAGHVIENVWITGPGSDAHGNTGCIWATRCQGITIRNCILHNSPVGFYYKHGIPGVTTDAGFIYENNLEYDIYRSSVTVNHSGAIVRNNIFGVNHPGMRLPEESGVTAGDYNLFDHNTFYDGNISLTDESYGNQQPGGVDPLPGSLYNTLKNNLLGSRSPGTANNTLSYNNHRTGSAGGDTGSTTGTPTYVGGDFTTPAAYALTGSVGVNAADDGSDMGADVSLVGPKESLL